LYFVLRVTGIPATEAQAIRTRGEEYRRYQRTTSAFVPWFPKTIPQEREPKAARHEPLVERDLVPDWILRAGIRRLVAQRLRDEDKGDPEKQQAHLMSHIDSLKSSPIAIHTPDANRQHYEVPAEFFALVLGSHRKYSCCYWQEGDSLDTAERRMLDLTAERAQIEDGLSILDLGCGWGAFSLYAAARFPNSTVVGLLNSHSQRQYIENQALERGLTNLCIVTADINGFDRGDFEAGRRFNRIVCVEMMEHVRNYERLLRKVASWMNPKGFLFVHLYYLPIIDSRIPSRSGIRAIGWLSTFSRAVRCPAMICCSISRTTLRSAITGW